MILWFTFVRNNSKISRWFPFIKSVTICNWFLRYYFTRAFFTRALIFTFYESVKSVTILQIVTLLMKGNQRLVSLLVLTYRVLRNPSREFWIATTLKLLKNLFRLWGIFPPNLRILSRKNNESTPFILFLAMTVTTNTSDRPNVSLVHG